MRTTLCAGGQIDIVQGGLSFDQRTTPMKLLHVHVSMSDLVESVPFYSALFAVQPTVQKDDYGK